MKTTCQSCGSQTPFGCWSDQDLIARSISHNEIAVTNAFRLLVRSGPRQSGDSLQSGNSEVTNAFRLLVRSGL